MGLILKVDPVNKSHVCDVPYTHVQETVNGPMKQVIGVGSVWRCDDFIHDLIPCSQYWLAVEAYGYDVSWRKISTRKFLRILARSK